MWPKTKTTPVLTPIDQSYTYLVKPAPVVSIMRLAIVANCIEIYSRATCWIIRQAACLSTHTVDLGCWRGCAIELVVKKKERLATSKVDYPGWKIPQLPFNPKFGTLHVCYYCTRMLWFCLYSNIHFFTMTPFSNLTGFMEVLEYTNTVQYTTILSKLYYGRNA